MRTCPLSTFHRIRVLPVIILLSVAVIACSDDGDTGLDGESGAASPTTAAMVETGPSPTPGMMDSTDATPADGMGSGMGGEALGGTAQTMTLAEATVEALPDEPLAWVAHDSTMLTASSMVMHEHDGPGFIYAAQEAHTVTIAGEDVTLQPGEAVFIEAGVEHTHSGESTWWDIRLVDPESGSPSGMEGAMQIFTSPPLEGIPETPVNLAFILVELPPGSETSIHTHPGPEYIYVTQGEIDYQNAIIGTEQAVEGDDHALPADTAVQKRNPTDEAATFLSLFVVDPDQPFAPHADFE